MTDRCATAAGESHLKRVRRSPARHFVTAALAAALVAVTGSSRAEPAPNEGDHRIVWDYPRFRPWEYTASIGVLGTAVYIESVAKDFSPVNNWHGILFDDAVRNAFHSSDADTRNRVAKISDYMWNATQYYPVLIDSLLVPIVFDKGNIDVASQMLLIDLQVESLSFFLVRVGARAIGRDRPSVQECANNPDYDGVCHIKNSAYASFFSGHAIMSFSGAALTCAHHAALPLYGSSFLGSLACAMTMTSATVVAGMRIVADKHWATDVLIGSGLGLGLGLGLPYVLHYGPQLKVDKGPHPVSLAMMPMVATDALGLSVVGMQ